MTELPGCKRDPVPLRETHLNQRAARAASVTIMGPHIAKAFVLNLMDDGTGKVSTLITDEPSRADPVHSS